jgi:hypothetical protein
LPDGLIVESDTAGREGACPDGLSARDGKTRAGMVVGVNGYSGFIAEIVLIEPAVVSIFEDLMPLPASFCERKVISCMPIFVDP